MPQGAILIAGFVVSAAMLAVSVALYIWTKRCRLSGAGLSPWHRLCVCVFASVYVFELSQVLGELVVADSPLLQTLFSAVQMFLLEKDIDLDTDAIRMALGELAQPYITYNALLYLLAPLTTLSAALVLFSKYVSLPLLRLQSRRREVFLFSDLTEDSLELATSVASHDATFVVAFADVDSCEDEELVLQAREARFLCLSESISTLLSWCSRRATLHVVLSSGNEVSNLHNTLAVVSMLAEHASADQNITIHAVSDTTAIDNYVDAASEIAVRSNANIRIRRINKTADLVRQLLLSNPLFLPGLPTDDSRDLYEGRQRHVIIVGHDDLCYEFLKGALWCGRAKGLAMRIELIDESAQELERRLAFECPELHALAGTEYDLRFFDLDPMSDGLLRHLGQCAASVSYVLLSLDDELVGIHVAKRVRETLERERIALGISSPSVPLVAVRVADTLLAQTLAKAQVPKGQSYGLVAVGSRESLLSYKSVFHPTLETWARNLNRAYWGYFDLPVGEEREALGVAADEAYERLEYNRNSSMASAIFLKYDLYSFCRTIASGECELLSTEDLPDAQDWQLSLDDAAFGKVVDAYEAYVREGNTDWLQRLEHERWNGYVRTLGFCRASEDEYRAFFPRTHNDQDQLARLHICLVSYDDLDRVDAMVERVEGSPRAKGFKDVDKAVIGHLPQIVRSTRG